MIIKYKMSSEKKEKYSKKIDKMMDFLEEFKECLESGDDYEDEEWEEEPEYRSMKRGNSTSIRGRYSRRGSM